MSTIPIAVTGTKAGADDHSNAPPPAYPQAYHMDDYSDESRMSQEYNPFSDPVHLSAPKPPLPPRHPSMSQPRTSADLNSTAASSSHTNIPGVLFAIPFPAPAHAKENPNRPAFLLYAPPRAAYHRPAPGRDGSAGKEKLVKRVERGWQEEVAQGVKIRKGEVPDAGKWARTKGALTSRAAKVIQWLPDSNIEALSRVPPKEKMHKVLVFVPSDPTSEAGQSPSGGNPAMDQKRELEKQLLATRSKAVTRTAISGVLLPVTCALDWIVPVFAFEVDAAYFTAHLQGLRKATALTGADVHLALEPSQHLAPLAARLSALCRGLAPRHFPDGDAGGAADARLLAEAVARQFREAVPPAVAARHNLDDVKALADDIERCLEKGAKEFVKTL